MRSNENVSYNISDELIDNNSKDRIVGIDFARGLACIGMLIYHTAYNLYTTGLVDTLWTRHIFWYYFQLLILSTFVFVSGMSFVLDTSPSINWYKWFKRVCQLGVVACAITIVTYVTMPNQFVRFGVIHFFTVTILLAPLFRAMKNWVMLLGLAIVLSGMLMTRAGLYSVPWLYMTGLMSNRPSSIDYIPLVPWFGVFLLGMGLANLKKIPRQTKVANAWSKPIIYLGKHSLAFYIVHLLVVLSLLLAMAMLLR